MRKSAFVGVAGALGLIALDQATKAWIRQVLPIGASWPFTSFFNLSHQVNKGGAWSILWGNVGFLATVAFLVSVGIIGYMFKAKHLTWVQMLGLTFVLAGALGNFIDRALLGHVTDFLDFYWAGWHFPTFNVADICICTGAGVLMLFGGSSAETAKSAGSTGSAGQEES